VSVVFLDGRLAPKAGAALSPDDRGFLFGDGVYEVARAVDGRFFALDAHLERLARGGAALGLAAPPRRRSSRCGPSCSGRTT
jgi:branched-subunit amino acid aminotransferase/4-amino-4-deoxychorismate lyase